MNIFNFTSQPPPPKSGQQDRTVEERRLADIVDANVTKNLYEATRQGSDTLIEHQNERRTELTRDIDVESASQAEQTSQTQDTSDRK